MGEVDRCVPAARAAVFCEGGRDAGDFFAKIFPDLLTPPNDPLRICNAGPMACAEVVMPKQGVASG